MVLNRRPDQVAAWVKAYTGAHPEVKFSSSASPDFTEITAIGKAGHGSRPDSGVNAITHLARMVTMGDRGEAATQSLADGTAAGRTLQFLSKIIGGATDGSSLGIDRHHQVMGDTTVNVGQVVTDSAGVHSYLNIRGPIGLSANQIESALIESVAPLNGRVEMIAAMDPLWIDADQPFLLKLVASYRRWSDDQRPPLSIGGTTYAKAFPGYVAFGMGFPDEPLPVHAPNERMPVELLRNGMNIYVDAIVAAVGLAPTTQ